MIRQPVAIVTGGGRRLGRQIALALAENGFATVVNYNESRQGAEQVVKTIRANHGKAIALHADVSQRADVKRLIQRTIKAFGRIDVLVNNAAIFIDATLDEVTDEIWHRTLDINLKSVLLCSQAVMPFMLKRKSGKIINIASIGGLQAWTQHIPYTVSKAGVVMLTKCIAKALAPHVCVNAIAPGTIIIEGEEDSTLEHLPASGIPLKKFGTPSDITSLVLYLATTASYITGQVIPVDGGRSIS